MKGGDCVQVYPHGKPELAADATVRICSANQCAIAVSFDARPPFAKGDVMIHSEFGIMLFAQREKLNGVPWGPWIEILGGGHFEIEEVAP
jgi:hypothetical protein